MYSQRLSAVEVISVFLFLNLILSSSSQAGGGIDYTYSSGSDDSWSQTFGAFFNTDDYRWIADLSYTYSDASSEEQDESQDRYAGLTHYFDNNSSVGFYFQDYDEHILEIKTKGVAVSLAVNEWLSYNRSTVINFDYSEAIYSSKGFFNYSFRRKGYMYGIDQTITDQINFGLNYTHFEYSEDLEQLADRQIARGRRLLREAFETSGLRRLSLIKRGYATLNSNISSYGFMRNTWTAYLGWQALENYYINMAYSETDNYFEGRSILMSLTNSINITDQFYLTVTISSLEYSAEENTKFYDFSLGYLF